MENRYSNENHTDLIKPLKKVHIKSEMFSNCFFISCVVVKNSAADNRIAAKAVNNLQACNVISLPCPPYFLDLSDFFVNKT